MILTLEKTCEISVKGTVRSVCPDTGTSVRRSPPTSICLHCPLGDVVNLYGYSEIVVCPDDRRGAERISSEYEVRAGVHGILTDFNRLSEGYKCSTSRHTCSRGW